MKKIIQKLRRLIIFLLFIYVLPIALQATELTDTLQMKQTPIQSKTRLSIHAELSMRPGGEYRVEQNGETIEQGENDLYTKASFRASIPLYQRGRTIVSTSLKYAHIHQHFNPGFQQLDYGFEATTHHIFSTNIMAMGRIKFWDRPLMLMGMVSGECSQYGFERWMAMGTAVVMLKETRCTQFGIGLLGLVNTFSKIPVFPFFTYRHTFNKQWMLNLVLPNLQVCYSPSDSNLFTVGMSIDADHYFIHPNTEGLPDRVRYSRCVQNLGTTYEHRFSFGLSVIVDVGFSVLMTDRINKSGGSNKIADIHEKAAPYCRMSVQKRF